MEASAADGSLEIRNSQEEALVEGWGVDAAVGAIEGLSRRCARLCYFKNQQRNRYTIIEEAHCAFFSVSVMID